MAHLFKAVSMLASLLAAGACQTPAASTPAALTATDAETMAVLKATLADAMGRAQIDLGPEDLTAMSSISVLPPPAGPAEDRSLARPTQFDLMMKADTCYAVRRDTGEEYALTGVSCRPL